MKVILPKPYPDELLYSVIARYLVGMGREDCLAAIHYIFGKKVVGFVEMPVLIGRVEEITKNEWGLTAENIIGSHTLLPFFVRFSSEAVIRDCIEKMINCDSHRLHTQFRSGGLKLRPQLYMQFCRECRDNDLMRYGETYWRRLHQVQGVFVCPEHKIELNASKAYMRHTHYPYYLDATKATKKINQTASSVINEHMNKALHYANRCKEILNRTDKYWHEENLPQLYRREVIKLGYTYKYKTKLIDLARLNNDFKEFWGSGFLEFIFGFNKELEYSWLKIAFKKQGNTMQTIHSILFQMFLESFR